MKYMMKELQSQNRNLTKFEDNASSTKKHGRRSKEERASANKEKKSAKVKELIEL